MYMAQNLITEHKSLCKSTAHFFNILIYNAAVEELSDKYSKLSAYQTEQS